MQAFAPFYHGIKFQIDSCTTESPLRKSGSRYFNRSGLEAMGKRRHPRVDIRLPVRIFGTDAHGHPFFENVLTINIGAGGVLLDGVSSELKMDEIIGLTYGQKKNRFQIRWLPEKGSPSAGRVGLSSVPGQAPMWDTTFPVATEDGFFSKPVERRKHPRLKHAGSV